MYKVELEKPNFENNYFMITIYLDIDDVTKRHYVETMLLLMKRHGFIRKIYKRKSSSRKGLHYMIEFKLPKSLWLMKEYHAMLLRYVLHDDIQRIQNDLIRQRLDLPIDVVFKVKNKKKAQEWREIK